MRFQHRDSLTRDPPGGYVLATSLPEIGCAARFYSPGLCCSLRAVSTLTVMRSWLGRLIALERSGLGMRTRQAGCTHTKPQWIPV
jgi:hypothetical protein